MELELNVIDSKDSGNYQCKRDKVILKNVFLDVSENNGKLKNSLHKVD
jgi:hypothetical protein